MASVSHRHPRPGLVLEVDRSTPPILFHHGEGLRLEKLPPGRSRVIYPAEPLDGLENPDHHIREALENPLGDCAPLSALMKPGMKLTIAFDDVSLPLPPMRRPDIRQRVIEAVLDTAAAAGVDDVHLIAALALHRRMTEDELRHAVGDRVYDAFAPSGQLYNHDAEDPDGMVMLGETPQGEEVQLNKRAAESDLIVYVNINLVSMDGGWKSTATGLSGYRALRHHHTPETMVASKSFMDRHRSELHHSNWRQGKVLKDSGVRIFQIETTVNNNTFGYDGPLSMLQKREWEWTRRDRALFMGMQAGLKRMTKRARRKAFQGWRAPYELTSVQAGEVDAVHESTTQNVFRQHMVPVEGQTDILTMGLPYICPYNVNSIMNPILVASLGLGYFFNMYRGKPLVREGGVLIMSHPTQWDFHPVHHPSYIDFFEQVLAETTDPFEMSQKYERSFAEDEWYRHLYRTSYAYHGVHPFYMWYWCAHALDHLGAVIVVGGETRAVRRLGFRPASTLQDALEMATDVVGSQPSITHYHNPPILMADVS
ncbi:MAG: lactate racemase domain-containing protein [Acidimicrobiales bacterium]